jgi:hypothetical protein
MTHDFGVYRNIMTKRPTRPPDSNVSALLDEMGAAPPVKVPVVAFTAVAASVPVAFSSVVLFIAFEAVIKVAALVIEVVIIVMTVVGLVLAVVVARVKALVVEVMRGWVVVLRITGSVSDLLGTVVRTVAFTVVVLTLLVTAV